MFAKVPFLLFWNEASIPRSYNAKAHPCDKALSCKRSLDVIKHGLDDIQEHIWSCGSLLGVIRMRIFYRADRPNEPNGIIYCTSDAFHFWFNTFRSYPDKLFFEYLTVTTDLRTELLYNQTQTNFYHVTRLRPQHKSRKAFVFNLHESGVFLGLYLPANFFLKLDSASDWQFRMLGFMKDVMSYSADLPSDQRYFDNFVFELERYRSYFEFSVNQVDMFARSKRYTCPWYFTEHVALIICASGFCFGLKLGLTLTRNGLCFTKKCITSSSR